MKGLSKPLNGLINLLRVLAPENDEKREHSNGVTAEIVEIPTRDVEIQVDYKEPREENNQTDKYEHKVQEV